MSRHGLPPCRICWTAPCLAGLHATRGAGAAIYVRATAVSNRLGAAQALLAAACRPWQLTAAMGAGDPGGGVVRRDGGSADEIACTQRMAYGGAAIGRHEGKAVFVPGGIAGEDVLVEIVEERPRYARGRLVEVVAASPDRVAPPCEHCGECGGCQWQHIAYEAQLRVKREIVRGQLERSPTRPCGR